MKIPSYISLTLILVILIQWIAPFCKAQTDGFTLSAITFSPLHTNNLDLKNQERSAEINEAFDQPFYYLGSGGQCFAFSSSDRRYVIKFLKNHLQAPLYLLLTLPFPEPLHSKCIKRLNKIQCKQRRDLNSYKIAFEQLQEHTGLLHLHLHPTNDLNKRITIIDKLHIAHPIDLDKTPFILQKRGTLLYPHINYLMETGDLKGIQITIRSMLNTLLSRCQKGIFDEDPRIHVNLGFIDNQAFFIDIGRFKQDSNRQIDTIYKEDLIHITSRFRSWLLEKHPSLIPLFDQEIRAINEPI